MDIKDIKTIEDFIKEFHENGFGFDFSNKYKIVSISLKPLKSFKYGDSFDRKDLIEEINSIKLGIELGNIRYTFEDEKAYRAFKAKFNLL